MTNARDKANIPVLNFQSKGIDDNADATAITINSSEQVGIGTASPGTGLQVNQDWVSNYGSINVSHSTNSLGGIGIRCNNVFKSALIYKGGTSGALLDIGTYDAEPIVFRTNNSERMRITSAGNVGIGTSSPDNSLHVAYTDSTSYSNSTNDSGIQIENSNGTDNTFSQLHFRTGNADSYIRNIKTGTNLSSLAFLTDDGGTTGDVGEAMRIDSSGHVAIGHTTSGGSKLAICDGANAQIQFFPEISTDTNLIQHYDPTATAYMASDNRASQYLFKIGTSEKMRIASNGDAYFNKTSDSFSTTGVGILNTSQVQFVAANQGLLYCNRLSSDGQLAIFFQDNTEEGSINVSGTTVTYNGFTGTHWSRFTDNSTPTILRGTVLETLDEMCDWYNLEFDVTTTIQDKDGNDVTNTVTEKVPHVLLDSQSNGDVITYNHKGTDYQATIVKEVDVKHMMSKVSDNSDAKNVYGVFVAYDLDGEGYNDFYVASVGSYVVRIKQGETIAKGDLLQSNGDGTAKVQTDDNIKSSSFAKVLSTTIIETYEDGSYLVPCSLMC